MRNLHLLLQTFSQARRASGTHQINGLETPHTLYFTGVNALVFADISDADSSQATAINAVAQQISIATGVALAGAILDVSLHFHGGGLALADFHIAFLGVAGVAVLAAVVFLRLPRDAGSAVSGHRAYAQAPAPGE